MYNKLLPDLCRSCFNISSRMNNGIFVLTDLKEYILPKKNICIYYINRIISQSNEHEFISDYEMSSTFLSEKDLLLLTEDCPCSTCIIKSTCKEACEKYDRHIKNHFIMEQDLFSSNINSFTYKYEAIMYKLTDRFSTVDISFYVQERKE